MASLRNTSKKETSGTGCFLTFVPLFLTVIGLSLGLVLYFMLSDVEAPVQASMPRVVAAGSGTGELAGFYAPPVLRWSTALENWSGQYGLDVNLVATVMQIESCGDPEALSFAGAAGLFQVMPFHFSPGEDSMDPGTNARRGLGYLKLSLDSAGGDVYKALAGYNGGIGVQQWDESQWPAETRRYANWGYRIYVEAASGASQSPALQEWLNSGGASLCDQAASRTVWLP